MYVRLWVDEEESDTQADADEVHQHSNLTGEEPAVLDRAEESPDVMPAAITDLPQTVNTHLHTQHEGEAPLLILYRKHPSIFLRLAVFYQSSLLIRGLAHPPRRLFSCT